MRERDLFNLFLAGGILVTGCVPVGRDIPVRYLPSPTPTLNPLDAEMRSNEHIKTQAEKDQFISETAVPYIGLNWERLEAQGLSKRAIETSNQLVVLDKEDALKASGNFLRYKDERDGHTYRIIVSGGHFYEHLAERREQGEQSFYTSRDRSFENSGIARFDASKIGISFKNDSTGDIGFVAIREDVFLSEWLGDMLEESVLAMNEISFDSHSVDEKYSMVCYPKHLPDTPTVGIDAQVNPLEPPGEGVDVWLDDVLAKDGCTGALYFNEEDKATAVTTAVLDYEKSDPTSILIFTDNAVVFEFASLGETPELAKEVFTGLIEDSIDDFNSRNP